MACMWEYKRAGILISKVVISKVSSLVTMNWPQVLRLTRTVPLRFRWHRCHPSGALGAVRVGICVRLDELFLLLARFYLSVNKETGSSVSHVWDNWVSSLIILI